jgi:pimeloyl-ACP methyl ester carboxylesterase
MGLELQADARSRGLTEEGIIHIPGINSRWVRLANGAKAHYITSGESGPAVILLHGGIEGSSGTAGFRFMCTYLASKGFRVYAPDRPGFGKADTSRVEYLDASPKAQVQFVKDFADAMCIDKFHLSGNSAGCIISANFVITHPERVLSVAFIAGSIGDITPGERIPPTQGKFTPNPGYVRAPYDGTEASMRDLMEGIIYEAKAIWPELITMRTNDANEQRRARIAAGMPAFAALGGSEGPDLLQVFTSKNRIDKLTIPMIYLYGRQDVLLPVENGFNQEDSAPNIQFFYPDECGHQGQTDQPDLHNQVFAEFFSTGKVSWESAQWAGVSRRRPINPKFVEEPAGGFPKPIPEAYTDNKTLNAALGAVKTPEPAE